MLHFSVLLYALVGQAAFSVATPAPDGQSLNLDKRAYRFPGCISGTDGVKAAPCTCSCTHGYQLDSSDAIVEGGEVSCVDKSGNFYGPVGCFKAPKGGMGAEICNDTPGCIYGFTSEGPAGCFCCDTNCAGDVVP